MGSFHNESEAVEVPHLRGYRRDEKTEASSELSFFQLGRCCIVLFIEG